MPENGEKTGNEYQKEPGGEFKEGNPGGGRPPGKRNFRTIYREAMEKLAEINDMEGEELEDELIQRAIKAARDGEFRFFKHIMNRLYGKPTQKQDITSDGEQINFVMPSEIAEKNDVKDD